MRESNLRNVHGVLLITPVCTRPVCTRPSLSFGGWPGGEAKLSLATSILIVDYYLIAAYESLNSIQQVHVVESCTTFFVAHSQLLSDFIKHSRTQT